MSVYKTNVSVCVYVYFIFGGVHMYIWENIHDISLFCIYLQLNYQVLFWIYLNSMQIGYDECIYLLQD